MRLEGLFDAVLAALQTVISDSILSFITDLLGQVFPLAQ
jgi:hypothetical protein